VLGSRHPEPGQRGRRGGRRAARQRTRLCDATESGAGIHIEDAGIRNSINGGWARVPGATASAGREANAKAKVSPKLRQVCSVTGQPAGGTNVNPLGMMRYTQGIGMNRIIHTRRDLTRGHRKAARDGSAERRRASVRPTGAWDHERDWIINITKYVIIL
jgi:hypothetical protein